MERGLEVACSLMFDLLNHLLVSEHADYPGTYEQSLERARDHGILTPELYAHLKGMGHFRNILAHRYVEIDPAKVRANLQVVLVRFPEAIVHLRAWADARSKKA